ncbi:unnamed protein product [Adineta ricciae]|uniref:Protein SSUH2-like protein n=1 Tax=Adineta ricciae TaxID=249248 RepID=A0A814VT81_ADIRI|nr:unnamed protein product [Adineta ricciae]CAF1195363.1 unnamed protein product [Adineta ricciae]
MSDDRREVVLDVNELSKVNNGSEDDDGDDFLKPRELPKLLVDLKTYVDSKFCYHSGPIDDAAIIKVEPKTAYQCSMKILFETRKLRLVTQPYPWKSEKVLGSRSLGRFFENTEIEGEAVGNIWTDYSVPIPSADKHKETFALSESTSYSRCRRCRATCVVLCSKCEGDGKVRLNDAYNTKVRCNNCRGSGKMTCGSCNGLGGFRHVPTLTVKWFTRHTICFYQNSFLAERKIRKGQRTPIWLINRIEWSKVSSIEECMQNIPENTPDIPLRENIIRDYYEKQLNPTMNLDNVMRRLEFSIEQMNFQEVHYIMGEHFVNKRYPTMNHVFRFCQYPGQKRENSIYENDYPYNCCGCFGEKAACFAPCCVIL